MNVELTRFKVKSGTSEIVDEWLKFLNDNMEDVLLTLDGEKMHIESIHREVLGDKEYLYWYSIQSSGGIEVENSESYIDKKHLEYWDKCIDYSELPVNIKTEVVMIPENIRKAMEK